jgi:hypothetical protein
MGLFDRRSTALRRTFMYKEFFANAFSEVKAA